MANDVTPGYCECGCGQRTAIRCGRPRRFVNGHQRLRTREQQVQRALSLIDRQGGPESCWPWAGKVNANGYGIAPAKTGERLAHRLTYRETLGDIPPGMFVCHHCDNPICCNPSHLFLGTPSDNSADMWAKGRHKPFTPLGDDHPRARLTAAVIPEIRRLCAERMTHREVAAMFGVCRSTITSVIRGWTWAHVP